MDFKDEATNQEESMTFVVTDTEGNEVEMEILFSFESEETGKNYIIYTDHTLDEGGNTKVYASVYNPDSEDTTLYPIETEREWDIIETILEHLQNETEAMDQWDITAVD